MISVCSIQFGPVFGLQANHIYRGIFQKVALCVSHVHFTFFLPQMKMILKVEYGLVWITKGEGRQYYVAHSGHVSFCNLPPHFIFSTFYFGCKGGT